MRGWKFLLRNRRTRLGGRLVAESGGGVINLRPSVPWREEWRMSQNLGLGIGAVMFNMIAMFGAVQKDPLFLLA